LQLLPRANATLRSSITAILYFKVRLPHAVVAGQLGGFAFKDHMAGF